MPKALPSPSTLRTPDARWPQDMTMSSTPCLRSQSIMNAMNGRSTSGTTGFGTVEVNGRSRVPSPPARMSACTDSEEAQLDAGAPSGARGAADPLVDEPRVADPLGVQEVAPVDEQVAPHRVGNRPQVQLAELGPLGDEHERVRSLRQLAHRRRELHPANQLAGLLLGHRIVGRHAGAGGLEAGGEHER